MDSARSWRRRPPAAIERALALFALAVAGAAPAQPAPGKADGAAALDSFLAEVHSLTAEFRQEVKTKDQSELDTGTLAFERPNRFRWLAQKPNELLVVADGKKIWTYDVELAQITVGPFDESIGSGPAMLQAGGKGVGGLVDDDDHRISRGEPEGAARHEMRIGHAPRMIPAGT